jgi:putative transcriptional regulator
MEPRLFKQLLQSIREAGQYARGERLPARVHIHGGNQVKRLREVLHFSQSDFAKLLDVQMRTVRNWENGPHEPRGPLKALLRAMQNDPPNVVRALSRPLISLPRGKSKVKSPSSTRRPHE